MRETFLIENICPFDTAINRRARARNINLSNTQKIRQKKWHSDKINAKPNFFGERTHSLLIVHLNILLHSTQNRKLSCK